MRKHRGTFLPLLHHLLNKTPPLIIIFTDINFLYQLPIHPPQRLLFREYEGEKGRKRWKWMHAIFPSNFTCHCCWVKSGLDQNLIIVSVNNSRKLIDFVLQTAWQIVRIVNAVHIQFVLSTLCVWHPMILWKFYYGNSHHLLPHPSTRESSSSLRRILFNRTPTWMSTARGESANINVSNPTPPSHKIPIF